MVERDTVKFRVARAARSANGSQLSGASNLKTNKSHSARTCTFAPHTTDAPNNLIGLIRDGLACGRNGGLIRLITLTLSWLAGAVRRCAGWPGGDACGFVAQMVFWDSLHESSVIAEGDEQLDPYEVQDQELVVLQ